MHNPTPTDIKLLQKSRTVEITFDDGAHFIMSCEYLRTHSPSAETKYQKPIINKQDVNIIGIEPVGNYAVKFIFDDGHDSGIYSWQTLYELGQKSAKISS